MRFTTLAFAFLLPTIITAPAMAAEKLVSIESTHSVSETADRIETILKAKGLKLVARIDHAAAATSAGLTLADTQVLLFGNPKLGTPLMQANPEIAIDLPMRMLVWSAADGKVKIGYIAPAELLGRYGLENKQPALEAMNNALAAIAKDAALGN